MPDLTLIGNAADFVGSATNAGPEWEHVVMLREPGCVALALDRLQPHPASRLPGRRFVDLGLLLRLAAALRQSGAALAQSEQSGYKAAFASAVSVKRHPLFIIFHGHRWSSRRNRAYAALVRRMPWVHFLCLSDSLKRLLIQEYGMDASRTHATGFGVDARYFSPAPLDGPGCIVSAGTASRDYKTLAAACEGLDTRVRVAADSTWYREALNIAPADVPANMEIASAGDYAGLRTLYQNAAFVVVPLLDVRHACGYAVIAEAMACGKAVIATRTGSPSDLIEDGVTGIYVPPGDAAALRKAIKGLLEQPGLAADMGQAGRERVEQEFDLDAYVGRIKETMQIVISKQQR